MDYKLIRSSRKTLSLSIDKSGRLVVRAPLGLPAAGIERFIEQKRGWIEKHRKNALENADRYRQRLDLPPESLPLFGKMTQVLADKPYGYTDGRIHLPEGMTLEKLLPYLRRLYMSIAKETLPSRTRLIAEKMGVTFSGVKINSAKTRWGSCSSDKVIHLSWKLIAADLSLIDYVIVHELCHTVHMDHSAAFWAMTEKFIPDYKERRSALKDVQKLLSEYGLD